MIQKKLQEASAGSDGGPPPRETHLQRTDSPPITSERGGSPLPTLSGAKDSHCNQCGSRTCKPNSVRLAAGRPFLWATHYCAAQATYPEVLRTEPARIPPLPWILSRTHRSGGNFLPIWSCSVWGLPCPLHYCDGGALLPHLFTLTPPIHKNSCRSARMLANEQGGMFSVALSVDRA
jgi:hypothetical protein